MIRNLMTDGVLELLTIDVADLFSGAGGSALGCKRALTKLGYAMKLAAVNHWPVAVETHTKNHPEAAHYCMDIRKVQPLEAVPTGRLDLLMASPTCTFFSRARGNKPISRDQRFGRMTPMQVIRWLTELDVRCVLVENVPEFMQWGPLMRIKGKKDKQGNPLWKPNPTKAGKHFRAWVRRIERLGYKVEFRVLNAADFGDATTRQRFFLIARKDGNPIHWPEPTHSRSGDRDLFGAGVKKWRGAREVISWELRGRSIFNREKPLARNTLERIYAGICRFGWPEPFRVRLANYINEVYGYPPEDAEGQVRDPRPLVMRTNMHKSNALCVREDGSPLPTVTTDGGLGVLEPFVCANRTNNVPKDLDTPLPTNTTSPGGGVTLVEPFVSTLRNHSNPKDLDQPVPAICASGNHTAVVEPSFTFPLNQSKGRKRGARSVETPLPTITATGTDLGVVSPEFTLSQASGGAPREVGAPVPTIATDGAVALVAPYYGTSECRPTEKPLPTVTTKDRFGLVTPLTHGSDTSRRERSTEQPLPTITGANRGELAFVTSSFGERADQAARVREIDAPLPTICAAGYTPLVQADLEQYDILFRMLEPIELAKAMGFSDEETTYEFVGNKTEVTRQIGNAVPVNLAAALVGAIFRDERLLPRAPKGGKKWKKWSPKAVLA